MSMFDEIDAFLSRAYPGSKLQTSNPFIDFVKTHHRKIVSRKDTAVANELMRESCWLVTDGDPTKWLSAVDAIEKRDGYYEADAGIREDAVQYVAKIRGRVDLETIRANAGVGITLLIAPASERMLDFVHLSFWASSAADLARVVAAHPESFLPPNYR